MSLLQSCLAAGVVVVWIEVSCLYASAVQRALHLVVEAVSWTSGPAGASGRLGASARAGGAKRCFSQLINRVSQVFGNKWQVNRAVAVLL